jgi:hypothetical protein
MPSMVSVLLLVLVGCESFDEKWVVRDFVALHPTDRLVDVAVGEGDGDAAYVHVVYKSSDDAASKEQVWQYLRTGNDWKLRHIEDVSPK